jgi:hypothetical protein
MENVMTPISCNEVMQVANFHGQASDAYAYVWMVQGSHELATWHSFVAWDRTRDVFRENKLPYTRSKYDTMLEWAKYFIFMDNTLKPASYIEQI